MLTVTSVGSRSDAVTKKLAMTEHERIAIDSNGLAACIKGQLVHEPDIARSTSDFTKRLADAGLRALVISPLVAQGTVFGVLIAARKEAETFSSNECEFLRQLSDHVALATHQAQLYTTLQQAYDELRQSQQTVMQQERLRALGQMASGVAHDINNAVAPIALYTDSLLEHESGLSDRARGYLNIIRRAIADVGETVKGMREFYRPQDRQAALAQIDLNPIVTQVIELTRVRWRDLPQQRGIAIAMRTELQQPLADILAQESDIRDALTNLIFNAVDAMPDGGTLTVRTRSSARRCSWKSQIPVSAWTRKRGGVAWSPSSRPRASAALASASPWSTAWFDDTARSWRSTACCIGARPCGSPSPRRWRQQRLRGKPSRRRPRPASALDPHRRRRSARARIAACHARERRSQGNRCRRRTSGHRRLRRSTAPRRARSTS